jgi:hypothetical protein
MHVFLNWVAFNLGMNWQSEIKRKIGCFHSYDILGAGMLWKPKEAQILTNFNEF